MMPTCTSLTAKMLLLLIAGLSAVLAAGKPSSVVIRGDQPSGMLPFGDITWEGELEKGRGNVTLTGPTFEDIENQAKQLNETYSIFDGPKFEVAAVLTKRDVKSWDCMRDKLRSCKADRILEGVTYLRAIKGTCQLASNRCSRVSCSWNSAIWWCNDNRGRLGAPCATIGDRASFIVDKCRDGTGVQGSATDDWNWRTTVEASLC